MIILCFTRNIFAGIIFLIVYVDDIINIDSDQKLMELKHLSQKKSPTKNPDNLKYFLGIENGKSQGFSRYLKESMFLFFLKELVYWM